MSTSIDQSVYPDRPEGSPLPSEFADDVEKADYVERICGAWDFDIFPEPKTFELFQSWRDIFDRYPLPHSPAYHSFRAIFRWPDVPRIANPNVHLTYRVLDRMEGRDPDPYEDLI